MATMENVQGQLGRGDLWLIALSFSLMFLPPVFSVSLHQSVPPLVLLTSRFLKYSFCFLSLFFLSFQCPLIVFVLFSPLSSIGLSTSSPQPFPFVLSSFLPFSPSFLPNLIFVAHFLLVSCLPILFHICLSSSSSSFITLLSLSSPSLFSSFLGPSFLPLLFISRHFFLLYTEQ